MLGTYVLCCQVTDRVDGADFSCEAVNFLLGRMRTYALCSNVYIIFFFSSAVRARRGRQSKTAFSHPRLLCVACFLLAHFVEDLAVSPTAQTERSRASVL